MFRLLGPGLAGLIVLALWVYCIFDVIATEESLIRNLPKTLWLFIVILVPPVGSLAWLLLGRPQFAGWWPGDTASRPARRARGPEDDPQWGSRPRPPSARPATPQPPRSPSSEEDRLARWENELRRREEELERREKEGGDPDPDVTPGA